MISQFNSSFPFNRILKIIVLIVAFPLLSIAQNKNDIDVTNYDIYITNVNFLDNSISGYTKVQLKVLADETKQISLSLFQLNIDSITFNGTSLKYFYDDTTIILTSENVFPKGKLLEYVIYYHGRPKKDISEWGGFYFSGEFAFNLGIGFKSNPHTIGRYWFPCNDNFYDRAYFQFSITTPFDKKAICNGILESQQMTSDGKIIWNWKMMQRIPPYLACVSVGPFYIIHETSNGIPVEIACSINDTLNVKKSFKNLDKILANYIDCYGPYPFDKIGFTLVPFGLGAMEHASSITIGNAFFDGTLDYETLWSHELSHMWWGDKVTCSSEKEIWLNEGFASYNEALTIKKLYGEEKFRNWLCKNHRRSLQFTHIIDEGFLKLDSIPTKFTYGSTTYSKSEDVIHTLHDFLGDSAFYKGCKNYLSKYADGNATSSDLCKSFTNASGINTEQFFNDWISTEGFPHFSIDSTSKSGRNFTIYTRQISKGNSHLYKMQVELFASNGKADTAIQIEINKVTNVFHVTLPFDATWFALDIKEKIADAITDYTMKVTNSGIYYFPETNVSLDISNVRKDTSIIRVELNWIKPDDFKKPHPDIQLSNSHYWKVDGIIQDGLSAKAKFEYNGTKSLRDGYLDNDLIEGDEDRLVLLYRPGTATDWEEVKDVTIQKGQNNYDKKGVLLTNKLMIGEYALGYRY